MNFHKNKIQKYQHKINKLLNMTGGNGDKAMFDDIYEQTKKLDIAMNALLVYHRIRNAFLVQSIDYGENSDGLTTMGPQRLLLLTA